MTCLAIEVDFREKKLRVCNAGHTFPIVVSEEGGQSVPRHLHKNQQPILGDRRDVVHVYEETEYTLTPEDVLIVYTDGLSEAKNLKSQIFGRFLMRSLRRQHEKFPASALRDEILNMFRYYTQGTYIDDDVCFLVVRMAEEEAWVLDQGA